jgi:hypothetical protein
MTFPNTIRTLPMLAAALLGLATPALAQDAVGDIELGANGRASGSTNYEAPASRSDVRIGLQIRLDALNMLGPLETSPGSTQTIGRRLLVPLAAPGVRFLDGKLFLGVGLGFYGWSTEDPDGDEASRSGFGLSPLAQFDVIREGAAALSLGGALQIASLSETEVCPDGGGCMDGNDGATGVGLSLNAGVRGHILPGLALGGDFGWGFLSVSSDNNSSAFIHGIFAAILLEATVGI